MLTFCEHFLRSVIIFVLCVTALTAQWRAEPESLRVHMTALGSDAMEGRGTGTPGIERAARYLEQQLAAAGAVPVDGMTSYRQTFPLHGSRAEEGTAFTLYAPKDSYALRLQEDYVLYSGGAQTFIPGSVRMVFVGYGIIAPEYDYNDYQSVDVRNAIVVFLSGEPGGADSSYFDGPRQTVHASAAMKQRTALARGARGSILIAGPDDHGMDDWYEQQRHFRFEEVRLLMSPSENLNILLNSKLAPFLFTDARYSYDDVERFARRGTMRSFLLELRAGFRGVFRERDFLASNIIGMVRGTDPVLRDTYVLLSAHYDHLGIGVPVEGDSIYNGVADNASGTAALLELARSFAQSPPERSILFAFLTGEERGFLGSQYYCLNPPVPLHRTVADINIDGLSLFERVRSVTGVGAELSSLGTMLGRSMAEAGIAVEGIPDGLFRIEQFRNSDQFLFAQAGIPSILVTEGLRYEHTPYPEGLARYAAWAEERYHTPFDDLQQPLDFGAAAQHTALLERFARTVAGTGAAPQWNDGVPYRSERLRTISEGR